MIFLIVDVVQVTDIAMISDKLGNYRLRQPASVTMFLIDELPVELRCSNATAYADREVDALRQYLQVRRIADVVEMLARGAADLEIFCHPSYSPA